MEILGKLPLRLLHVVLCALFALAHPYSSADPGAQVQPGDSLPSTTLEQQVKDLALAGTQHAAPGVRFDVQVGQLDPRLHLAPCQKVEPYLPSGARLWGKTRIGLRCVQGPSPWNVYLPVTVKVYAKALVATAPLAMGAIVTADDVTQAEVDLAEDASVAVTDTHLVVGRTLARAINPGQSVRQAHLKVRQWFAAGETVKVMAVGSGFSVAGEGQALTPGMEGQPARVKTESGRVLTGMPTGDHRVELAL
ncbi:MAG: flagellar basal body P-ring formation protein FlgA [Burkholderiales bacterium]|nr:flagellar basal body P-ring formation protein FlgA [Burkholderiales bacterium]